MLRAGWYTATTEKLFRLTLPPLPTNARVYRPALIGAIIAIGFIVAWLPLNWAALLVVGTIFLVLLLLKPILALYALIPIIPFSSLLALPLGGFKIGGMELILALGLLAWLLQIITRQNQSPGSAPLILPFLFFLGAVSLSWLTALSIGASLIETAKWIEMLALYLFVFTLLTAGNQSKNLFSPLPQGRSGFRIDSKNLRRVIAVIVLAGVAQAGLGLYQFIFKVGPEGFLLFGGRFLRAYGTFAQPNPYAGYLGLVLPLALSLTIWAVEDIIAKNKLNPSHLKSLLFYGVSLGLMLAALYASQSRGAWMGFAVAAVITVGLRNQKAAMFTLAVALAGTVVALAGSFDWGLINTNAVTQRFGDALAITTINDISAVEVNDANFATIERLAHWQAASDMWRDHPWLGVGFGNYAAIYPAYALGRWLDPLGHAHNYLLNLGAETGLVGLTAYLIFWILVFRVSWLALRHSRGFERAAAAGGLGILVYLHVHNFVDNLYVQGMYLHVAIILALISTIYQCRQTISTNKENYQE